MDRFLEKATAIREEIVQDRRAIHRHPEVGFDLSKTAGYVMARLNEMGIEAHILGGPLDPAVCEQFELPSTEKSTGVVATIGSGRPCIMLRADMDALPMTETPGLCNFTSENPQAAHTCGHDSHTAMLLGAARILKEMEAELPGTVKFMFQTGEEYGCGSRLMIEKGLLENPTVDAAFALHVAPDQECGVLGYTEGICSAAMDTYIVKILGKGGHTSQPQLTIDPLMIANQLYTALNLLPGREIDPRETVALSAGVCGGGTATNIIPDTADLMIAARTFNRDVSAHLCERIPEMIDHVIKMWRGDYTLRSIHTPSTYTDVDLARELVPYIRQIVGENGIHTMPCMAATEDFSHVSNRVPAMFCWLGAGAPGNKPVHNPSMFLDENCFPVGTAVLCAVAWNYLNARR